MGKQAPGANNVVDGLLRFQEKKDCKLIGFINGVDGLINEKFVEITRNNY